MGAAAPQLPVLFVGLLEADEDLDAFWLFCFGRGHVFCFARFGRRGGHASFL